MYQSKVVAALTSISAPSSVGVLIAVWLCASKGTRLAMS